MALFNKARTCEQIKKKTFEIIGPNHYLGLGRVTFFMVRVGFRACGFGSGWARATGNVHGLITGHNISYSGHIRAAFGPHLGHIWAAIIYK